MARWKVRDEDARALLGGVTNGPFYEMKRNPDRVLDTDRLTRISLLIGIFKALHILHSEALADEWVRCRTPIRFSPGDAARLHDARRPARDPHRPPAARRSSRRVMRSAAPALRQVDTHRLVPSRHLPAATACSSRSRRR